MKYKIELWNKKSEINGNSAESVLQQYPNFRNEDVLLFINENTKQIERMENPLILKDIMGFYDDAESVKIGEMYLNFIEEENKKAQQNQQKEEALKENAIKELTDIKLENMQLKNNIEILVKDLTDLKLEVGNYKGGIN